MQLFDQMFNVFKDHESRLEALESKLVVLNIPQEPYNNELELPEDRFYTATNIGEAHGMTARELNKFLQRDGLIEPACGGWRITEKYANRGYAFNSEKKYYDGEKLAKRILIWWTPKGKDYVCELLRQCDFEQIQPVEYRVPTVRRKNKK